MVSKCFNIPFLRLLCSICFFVVLVTSASSQDDNVQTEFHRSKRHVGIVSSPKSSCRFPRISCDRTSRYRRPDATCTNFENPFWGSSLLGLRRVVPNTYDDGVSVPRLRGVDGKKLPSPRAVSNAVTMAEVHEAKKTIYTNFFQVFGQFVDHDIDFSPNIQGADGKAISCCTDDLNMNGGHHPDVAKGGPCFTIDIPENDTVYSRRCMQFVRSMKLDDPKFNCNSGTREQKNVLTSFIDGTHVYGANAERLEKVRLFRGGLLKFKGNTMLPEDKTLTCVKRKGKSDYCPFAGDTRANEHPGLTAAHTIFLRLHNKIATYLQRFRWSDEVIFQQTRKIVEAIVQQISVHEWLPLVIGPEATRKYRIKSRYGFKYNPKLDPTVINAFSTAAFRYGHSSVPNKWTYGTEKIPIVTMFNSPYFVLGDDGKGLDKMVDGMLEDFSQDSDKTFSDGLKNRLFETMTVPGMDLAAINIQRGRDHGLGTYNDYRRFCDLEPIVFDNSTARLIALASVYESPEDVDLFIGGVTEPPVPDGVVGETFACIIGQQFHNLKYGDRLWFENEYSPAALTRPQIHNIRRITMSSVLCYTTNRRKVPQNAFLHEHNGGSGVLVSCQDSDKVPPLHINLWNPAYYNYYYFGK